MTTKLKFLRRLNFVVAGGISTTYLIGKYRSVDNLKETLELKVEDQPVPVPENLLSLLDEVKSDLKLDREKKYKYKFFMSKGIDLTHAAMPEFREVAYVGLPHYFSFDVVKDSDLSVLMDEGKPLTDPKKLNTLKKAISLSKEAKKFGVAREIFESHHELILPCGLLPLVVALNFNFLSYIIEKISKFRRKSPRLVTHLGLFMFGSWVYAILHDVLSVYKEADIDLLVSQLGNSYIRGGIEFYEKMIARNKIFKKIQKNAPFTVDGDINTSLFRTYHMPLQRRLIYLKEFEKGGTGKNMWDYVFYPENI